MGANQRERYAVAPGGSLDADHLSSVRVRGAAFVQSFGDFPGGFAAEAFLSGGQSQAACINDALQGGGGQQMAIHGQMDLPAHSGPGEIGQSFPAFRVELHIDHVPGRIG